MNFICAICGKSKSLRRLSDYSLQEARTAYPGRALAQLEPEDIVCRSCDYSENSEDLGLWTLGYLGRTDTERFEHSGTSLTPGRLVFLQQNY
jgi:hypothetical protein